MKKPRMTDEERIVAVHLRLPLHLRLVIHYLERGDARNDTIGIGPFVMYLKSKS